MKKLIKWLGLSGVSVLLVFFVARGCAATRNPLAFIDVNAQNIQVVEHESSGTLTDNHDSMVLQTTPQQISAILAQFKKHARFTLIPISQTASTKGTGSFSTVPPSAQCGSFMVEKDKNEEHPWFILCDFAADKKTGRLWLNAWSVYN